MVGVQVAPAEPLPFGEVAENGMARELKIARLASEATDGGGQSGCIAREFDGRCAPHKLIHLRARRNALSSLWQKSKNLSLPEMHRESPEIQNGVYGTR